MLERYKTTCKIMSCLCFLWLLSCSVYADSTVVVTEGNPQTIDIDPASNTIDTTLQSTDNSATLGDNGDIESGVEESATNEDKVDSAETKAIQQTIAGALQSDAMDPNEDNAPQWPMRIPKIPVKFDWVLLKKGELLGGDLIAMYQDKVEFDSDEVGVISIKMKDILQIRTKTVISVRTVNNRVFHGKVIITENDVTFIDFPDSSLKRVDILTITPSEKSGQSLWDGEISLGLNFKSGNSAKFDYFLSAKARRLSSSGRFSVSYSGIYSEVEDATTGENVNTENNQRFNMGYDYFFNKKLYFRLPIFEYYTDDFKNLDVQSTLGVALGYEVIDTKIWDNKDIELNIYSGPSVQYTRFDEVEIGVEDEDTSPVLAFGFDFEIDVTADTEFFVIYDGKWVNETSGAMINHLEVGVEIEVIDDFDIEIATIIDHVAEPTADENGVLPEKVDSLLTVSLEYSF